MIAGGSLEDDRRRIAGGWSTEDRQRVAGGVLEGRRQCKGSLEGGDGDVEGGFVNYEVSHNVVHSRIGHDAH